MSESQQRIVVTGASRGIGAAVANAFALQGAHVVGTARDPARVVAPPADATGTVTPVALDLGDRRSVDAAAGTIRAVLGGCDVLINNAGILGARTPLTDIDLDDVEHVIDVNVMGTLRLTQRLLPLIPDGGAIINVTSGAAGRATWGGYSISKAGIDAITEMLRDELRDRAIRCVALNPGGTRTVMRAEAYPDEDPATLPVPEAVVAPFLAIGGGIDPGAHVDARSWT